MAKRLVILGAGESGCGSAVLGMRKGFEVFLSDRGKIKSKYRNELNELDTAWEEEKHTEEKILNADLIVKSPGIPDKAEIVVKALKQNIPVISEIEFAAGYSTSKLIGITGSNGKTTTTLLTHHLLSGGGIKAGLAGNIGKSFARQVAQPEQPDAYVLEISSFQLDGMFNTRIHDAVLTNISPDHLDRYDYKLDNYIRSKFRISRNQTSSDSFIYNLDDELTCNNLNYNTGKATKLAFSIKQEVQNGAFLRGNEIIVRLLKLNKEFIMPINQLTVSGKHNLYNSMAAAIVASSFEIRNQVIRQSFSDFVNVEHRMEFVAKIKGVNFINDSKATNVNSAWYALESIDTPCVWIAGGTDKGNDYAILRDLVKEKVRLIVCLGLDNSKIHQAFASDVDLIINTASAKDAVDAAYRFAEKGDTVLLSPACASFDLFEDYEDRGNQFKKYVKAL
ncbi:MAG: UDP-N-acetylmuramoyl-L-alanine--D-glutamate ligase [Flavobacteriales bacterium]|nr:UDP-N-acetylmuramoyl-L-alanine--D-glutamate ligase [Flavobacteriales bacterium]